MSHHTQILPPHRRVAALVIAAIAVFGSAFALTAQTPAKKALTVEDYTRWRSISSQELSGDGKWVSYVVQFTNVPTADTKPVLHLMNLGTSQDVEIPNATNASFSADSRWLAYQVDPSAGRGGRGGGRGGGGAGAGGQAGQGGGTDNNAAPGGAAAQGGRGANAQTQPQQQRRVELRNLETGAVAKQWQDIASFNFSTDSNFLLLRRRPAQAGGGAGRAGGGDAPAAAPAGGGGAAAGAAPANPDAPRGTDITIHNLQTGKDQQIGNVGDSSFNKKGDLLAYSVDAPVKDGNGLFLVDLKASRTIALDNDAKSYNRLTWSEDGENIAVLKGLTPDKTRERENVLLVLSNVRAALGDGAPAVATLDPAKTMGFPKGNVVSDRATISWSDDGKRVFFGMKEQVPTPEATPRRSTDEVADVDVWSSMDERIQSVQMTRADQDRNFTFREAFDASNSKFVKLTDETMRDLELSQDGRWAVGRDTRGYISDYKPAAADFYRVNTSTGERTLILKNQLTGSGGLGISPDGNYYMFWKDEKFQAYDLNAGQLRPLGGPVSPAAPKFTNAEFDHPGPKPSYGIAGYTSDGRNVIVQQRYDLWVVPLDGTAAKNLTNGAGTKGEIRFRYVRTEPSDAGGGFGGGGGGRGGGGGPRGTIDLSKPITLSAYGEWTKKAGFYELANGQLREIVYEDASFSNPTKAAKADTYLFTRQTFVEFPDLRVSGANFKESKKITNVNPQQSEFLWGHRVLFDFQDRYKHRLQGILVLPDDYKPGEKRPMLVNFYEDNSQNLHRYSAPSYLTGMGSSPIQAVTEGYVTMIPDIHYHTGSSHSDQLDAVEAATRKVIEMGYVDPKRIGINGHSYGGEGAAFIGTRSRLFAAVGVGAGVTDLYTDFSQSWGWSYQVSGGSGANGNDYYLYGQGRWGFSPWEKPDVYHFESALSHVPEVTAPILIMHGTADPTVSFAEGMNFYNALRYNGKNAIMLAYPGEGHGLRGLANRKDLTIRYFQFFDHYLKDAPAPKWMTDGIPYLDKDQNKDPRAGGSGNSTGASSSGRAGGSGGF